MFAPVSNKVDFDKVETDVLDFWQKNEIFKKSLRQSEGKPDFVFFDGPPFATGLPHYGHLLTSTIKDIIPRYQTMRGHHVERRFGWDTHGLPIEALAQDALGVSGVHEIQKLGVDTFNEQCRSMVLRYVSEWRKTVTRIGRWVDFDNDYKTMNFEFMESVWWAFKQLWNQGRIYKSHRIMPYSWKLNTPLSNFEAGSNYKDVQDPTVTCRLKVLSGADAAWGTTYLLIWTTTPWTLPENLAVCAGASIDYVVVRDLSDPARACYVLAEARLKTIFPKEADREIVASFKGSALKDWTYEPLFPHFAAEAANGAFRVLNDDYVSTDDGVGLVHMAPAYGEDDFRVCRTNGMTAFVDPLDSSCNFTAQVPEYEGRFCKDCDKDIIKRLKAEGKLVHQATITHSYPFCDRTDTPLIYRAIDAWYVRVEDLHEKLAANNDTVHWTPAYVGEKRFGNWLREARDWNISRNRFWGSCLPVWINDDDPSDMICVGSAAELEALSGEKVTDLHKHFLDKIVIRRDGKTYHRTPEVLDCWFESGSMPYAQQHYPFERKDELDAFYPADFIAEGLDQTRGWFYTLMVLGTCIFGKSPYKNVVVSGLILAEDGKKMSKRLKNYPDPTNIITTYGADALRLYLIASPVVRAENLRFSESGVRQVLRDLLIPWWNAYSFFVTYANIDNWYEDAVHEPDSANELDRWIVSSLETLIANVTDAMDRYDLQKSVRPFLDFIDNLTNWYIRRSRRRFWKSSNDADKRHAYRTLRYVLLQLSKIAAPFTPFIAEAIYRNLRSPDMPESVHLCEFPTANAAARDAALEERMATAQLAVRLGHNLRKQKNLKVRQPLARAVVVCAEPGFAKRLAPMAPVIADELNVKSVEFAEDESRFVSLHAKANFKALGAKLGPRMKAVSAEIVKLTPTQLAPVLAGNTIEITPADGKGPVTLGAGEILITREEKAGLSVVNEGAVTVALDTALTPELTAEGIARECVSSIQNLRKESGFEVTQRIDILVQTDDVAADAINAFSDYVKNETLGVKLSFVDAIPENAAAADLNGHAAQIRILPDSLT
ncbi:MAG: isoleucine--tRNA ligase [Kiritimatiellia bacterium]